MARASPVTIEGDVKCGDCSIQESAYKEGYLAGQKDTLNNKQGRQEMSDVKSWVRSLCCRCENEFQALAALASVDLMCNECTRELSNIKQGRQEMSDLCNYSNQDIQEMIISNDDLMQAMVAIVKAGDLKTIGESSEGANKWNRHAMDFIYDELVGMAASEIEAIS